MSVNPCLQAAIEYRRRGWSPLPIGAGSKKPLVEWKPLQTQPASESEIRTWYQQWSNAGVGIVCGKGSGLVCVDLDFRNDDADARKALDGLPLPATLTEQTPSGGMHCYYMYPDNRQVRSKTGVVPHVDVKADGGFVVASPSWGKYAWVPGLSFGEIELAPVPDWVESPKCTERVRETLHSNNILTVSPFTAGTLNGDTLRALSQRQDFLLAAAPLLGIPESGVLKLGTAFPCPLPGHGEASPSASLFEMDNGNILLHDWHARDGGEWYTLPEVYAARRYGVVRKLSKPEQVVWLLVLLEQAGFIAPVPVEMPELPDDAGKADARVYESFRRVLGLRWLHTADAPMPFTHDFAAAVTGLSRQHAGYALKRLLSRGVIQGAGECRPGLRPLKLFAPGTAALVESRRQRASASTETNPA